MASSTGSEGGVKPTLLAFHGSGSNATIHTVQLARLMRIIKPYFNVESLEAPFPSNAGPGILPFFDGCGPFKRWLHSSVSIEEMKAGNSTNEMPVEVEEVVKAAVEKVRKEGGKVIGLIGFSQGTKVVAGLLKGSEILRSLQQRGGDVSSLDWLDFAFGVSVCGSYPPPLFPPSVTALVKDEALLKSKISIPTFHVQGLQDQWHWAGQGLVDGWYEVGEGKSVVRGWEMGHYYPVKPEESEEIGAWMVGVLKGAEGEKAVE
jgi:hypothetical protein